MDQLEYDWVYQARAQLRYLIDQGVSELVVPTGPAPAGSPLCLEAVGADLGECTRCPLHATRTNIIFGEGDPSARLMFIGEAPDADEDLQGRPFVGEAGRLLDKMIKAMGLQRKDIYIVNVLKCRPPGGSRPEPLEKDTCLPFLEAQIRVVKPEVIVALGKAGNALLNTDVDISRLRGKFHDRNGIPVMPTHHPSFLLRQKRTGPWKAECWSDLKQVITLLGLELPKSGGKS